MLLACRSGSVQTVRTLHELNATVFAKQLGIVQVSGAGCRRCTAHVYSTTGEHAPRLSASASLPCGMLVLAKSQHQQSQLSFCATYDMVSLADGTDAWSALETNGEMTVEERQRMLDLLDTIAASQGAASPRRARDSGAPLM